MRMSDKLKNNFEDAFSRFDFKKVRQVMRLLEWTWLGSNEPPTVYEMGNTVRDLLNKASEELTEELSSRSFGTGGFKVKVFNSGNVYIEFIAEESYVDWEE